MNRKNILFSLIISMCFSAFGQSSISPIHLVQEQKELGESFNKISLANINQASNQIRVAELDKTASDYVVLKLNDGAIDEVLADQPDRFLLNIPSIDGKQLEIELVKVKLFTEDFELLTASNGLPVNANLGIHYRGIVRNDETSIAALSVFKGELMGLFSSSEFGNLVLGKLLGATGKNGEHVLYEDSKTTNEFICSTSSNMTSRSDFYSNDELLLSPSSSNCVRLYIEVDKDIYDQKGGILGTLSYTTGLLNQVSTLYSNENVNTVISQIVVWDVISPYSSNTSSGMLQDFQAHVGNFNGDLAQLLSYQASGGIAAGFSGICNNNPDNSMSFSSIHSSYSTIPMYSWSVMVVTHEFGHLLGSRHTHACVWNGNNTAIDGCSPFGTEGNCPSPGFPSQGGTIMSYCHLQNVGINFNQGFGPQPGNVIRNSVANGSCLSSCDDDDPPPPPPSCPSSLCFSVNDVENCIDFQAWMNCPGGNGSMSIDWSYRVCGVNGGNYVNIGTTTGNGNGQHAIPFHLPSPGNYDNCYLWVKAEITLSNGSTCTRTTNLLLECNSGGNNWLSIYPNPAKSTFQVSSENTKISKVIVRNIYGRLIKEVSYLDQEISLNGQKPGVYYVEVIFIDGSRMIKNLILEE